LLPLVTGTDTTWLATALSDADRAAAEGADERHVLEAQDLRVRLVPIDRADQQASGNVICNATLWYVHHHLFDQPRRPRFDAAWWQAWEAYRRVNATFATAVAETAPEGATVLVQDYHLCLLGPALAEARPDLRTVHFSHTPFAGPDALEVLPPGPRRELLEGLAGHHVCGFHTERWRAGFVASCEADGVAVPDTFVAPLGPDLDDLRQTADSEACQEQGRLLEERLAGRRFLLRVDRVELSKNLLRGFWAYDHLLETHPEWREHVVFGAYCYPSREGLADYLAYQQQVEAVVEQVNTRWGTADWTPIDYDPTDNYPRSVAALARYDALLVNPTRDGMNLVAKEGPLLNQRDGTLVLSSGAGAWPELGEHALGVHPFDIVGTAEALHGALDASPEERATRAGALRAAAGARTPADWLADQRAAADAAG
jgi:trehalose 6-phosphate synthase